jgi:hypothetical protein
VKKSDAISDELNAADEVQPSPDWAVPVRFDPEPSVEQVPTLAKRIYQPVNPMLRARFQAFGRWRLATHGDWLSASDMAVRACGCRACGASERERPGT